MCRSERRPAAPRVHVPLKRTPLTAQDKAQWRDKVREECLQRTKEHRQNMLWRLRQVIYPRGV